MQSAKTVEAGHRYHIPLSLSQLSDHTTIKEKADPRNYDTFVSIYRMEDTLITYGPDSQTSGASQLTRPITISGSRITWKVVAIGSIPLDPDPGSEFTVEISVFGAKNIRREVKTSRLSGRQSVAPLRSRKTRQVTLFTIRTQKRSYS